MSAFQGRTAFVTGGASGIGRGLCEALAARGAELTVADIDFEGAQAVAGGILRAGGKARALRLDVADGEAVTRALESAGRLDYVFNNAGLAIVGEVRDSDLASWRRIVDVNLMGVVAGSLAAYRIMARQGSGHIVNTASLAGLAGMPVGAAYAMTKAGVVMFSQMLRAEGEALGVKVSAACPGFIRTPIFDNAQYLRVDKARMLKFIPLPIIALAPAVEGILAGVGRNDALIVLPFYARLIWRLLRWFPFLAGPVNRKAMADFRRLRIP
ncbi:MAG TPA: SDR family NAD(P)-dependent oxidoreductase [Burkholderiales bacterium]|nr:SDR family NAD(P)-dependent oxidoreductase [Burkholderiales bacterium]